ncbi:MAG: hypothetical protein HY744_30305 [Deltaproteobacteria bacterium]|nr:hypothetical protein [Deltaproteobacteria bacterium]
MMLGRLGPALLALGVLGVGCHLLSGVADLPTKRSDGTTSPSASGAAAGGQAGAGGEGPAGGGAAGTGGEAAGGGGAGGAGAGGTGAAGMGGAGAEGGGGTAGTGAGGSGGCQSPEQCAGQDTDCRIRSCVAGQCGFENQAAGLPCDEQGGKVCDGDGQCVPCVSASHCPPGQICKAQQCLPAHCDNAKPDGPETDVDCGGDCPPCQIGKGCKAGADCQSASCADGVCCGSVCQGKCEACAAAKTGGADGTCGPVVPGTDPDAECPLGQSCKGAGACAFVCGQKLAPPGGACPGECTGGCAGSLCIIDCTGDCSQSTIACPPSFACEVRCSGKQSCKEASIECPAHYSCRVKCDAADVQCCQQAVVHCPQTGTCQLECGAGLQACDQSALVCGENTCSASCQDPEKPMVQCGSACSCTAC